MNKLPIKYETSIMTDIIVLEFSMIFFITYDFMTVAVCDCDM